MVTCHPRFENEEVFENHTQRAAGHHADSRPPAGRKPFAMACECNSGREARPNLSLIPVVIDDQHSAATG